MLLIPQFSLRWLMGLTAVMALVFWIMRCGMQGSAWAVGVSAALIALAVVGIVSALLFALVWVAGLVGTALSQFRSGANREEAP